MTSVSLAPSARPARRIAVGFWGLLICALSAATPASPAFAANGADKPPALEPAPVAPAAPAAPPALAGKSAQPAPVRKRLTKFEARRIRHACQGRANERNLVGPEREAFLGRCYFGRVSTRVERQQCRQEATARGIERASQRAFIQECVRERVRAKRERKD
ncbi:hypothetical protein A1351_00025 [Methylosinus sp. R-45379]|uniref:hypothetical protein n=1 Tax=unclassified Methylosinus TaxID=2624500 RepID=UPI00047B396A|nr:MULTISPECIES: hypothetical protein [unclassified Methylosinus]OAI31777.1 hypothetical protein A1351_00025 [Methylosinus sp. R-45379]TDX67460.1 hypothetical protein EDE12_1011007 [Methylosinus sp. sav-2]